MKTARNLLFRILLPVRHVEAASGWWQVLNGLPGLGLALSAVLGFVVGVAGFVTLAAIVLFLSAFGVGYQLLAEQERREQIRPLVVDGVDESEQFRRLKISNPNAFTVNGVFVSVRSFEVLERYQPGAATPPLPNGFRFPWTTWGRDESSVLTRIAAGGHDYADILIGASRSGFNFATNANNRMVGPSHPQVAGIYKLVVEIGSEESTVPVWNLELRVALQASGLRLQIVGA